MPTPRSQVRSVIASGAVTWASEMLARSGKDRMVLEQRAEALEIVAPRRRRPRRSRAGCRYWRPRANAAPAPRSARSAARWRAYRGTPRRAGCRASRISARPCRRRSVRSAAARPRVEQARPASGSRRSSRAALAHQQPADAARGVAAGLDLAAVGVVDAHEGVGAGIRALDGDELVEADARAPVGKPRGSPPAPGARVRPARQRPGNRCRGRSSSGTGSCSSIWPGASPAIWPIGRGISRW